MRSEAPVDRFRRWTTRFGVGLLLVVVLGALTGTMAVAVSQERVAAYDYDGLSAPAWPDGGSAFAETSPVGRGIGAAVHAYAYDLPVAALVDTGRAQLPGDTFPHALGGEDDTAAPAAEVAGAATTPSVLASTPSGGAGPVRVGQAGENAVRGAYDIGPKATVNVNGRTRIFDGLTDTAVTEVKNISSLSYTQQLKDSLSYAQATGRGFDLYVRPDTYLSGPLRDAIARGDIALRFIP